MQRTAGLLLVLLGMAHRPAYGEVSNGEGFHAVAYGQQHQLKSCRHMTAQLPHQAAVLLRDAIQAMQAVHREQVQWNTVRARQGMLATQKPEERGGWERAYASHGLSSEQLDEKLQGLNATLATARGKVMAMVAALQGLGQLPLDLDSEDPVKQLAPCMMGRLNHNLYPAPTVSFLLQYFKRPWIIGRYIELLQACNRLPSLTGSVEVVVNVDDPADHEAWASLAANTSGFVVPVFSANVHEARAYNRIAKVARGKYLVLLQDDELPQPEDCSWLPTVLAVYQRWPSIGLLGLKGYNYGLMPPQFDNQTDHHFQDPVTKIPMQFVMLTDFAPMSVRKSAWKHVGGLDENLSDPGQCGIWGDWELAIRMWAAGWQVAFHKVDRKWDEHESGTHTSSSVELCWGRQQLVASTMFRARWHEAFTDEVTNHVRRLNLQLLERLYPDVCPFGLPKGCDLHAYKHA